MATPNTQMTPINDEQERAILLYAQMAHDLLLNQFSMRTHLQEIDRNYMREGDFTEAQIRARIANRGGDKKKIQDLTVPIIMPQVESALGYLANVFLTGYPIFGVSSDPSQEDAALQMETIIAENAITSGWHRQLMMFFRDGLKYNLHGVECEWQQKNVYDTMETDISMPNSAKPKKTLWAGNVLRRMDLYNTFFDPRVHPSEIHSEGEYAGYIDIMSRMRMKKFLNDLYGKVPPATVIRAFESSIAGTISGTSLGTPYSWYQPIINPSPIMNRQNQQTFDWMAWATAIPFGGTKEGIRYQNVYQLTKLYARIIPADFNFNVPEKNTPQVWKFIIVNGSVVLYGERQSNAHNFIPIFFGQPLEDGLDFQTKSFATNVTDMQDIASAMWNGFIASKRRLIGDRVLYDPLRVRKSDIESIDPAAKIPVRPAAYGKPVGESVFPFPFRDEQTNSFLQGADQVIKLANLINNQNPAQQGQFVKGNKTKFEYDDIMGHGNTHNQTMAIMTEAQVFVPMKEAIKLNILQYQPSATLFNRDKNQQVEVKPTDLRTTAVHFKINDGLTPVEQELSTDEFQTAIQTMLQAPIIGQSYNAAPLFTYLMKLRGADLSPFEKPQVQVMYEQQLQAWQQAAQVAAQKGAPFSTPMPQVPQELQGQGPAGAQPSGTSAALDTTQGAAPQTNTVPTRGTVPQGRPPAGNGATR